MARRLLFATALLAVLAAIVWILQSDPTAVPEPAAEGETTPGVGHESAEAVTDLGGGDARRAAESVPGIPATTAESALARAARLGIPSFRGRLLAVDGDPAAGAVVRAWGVLGFAGGLNPRDPNQQIHVAWEETCDEDGLFLLPETPTDGLRFVLRAVSADAPPIEIANLPASPGRTRDLGELRFRAGFTLRGFVGDAFGRAIEGARVVPISDPSNPVFQRRQLASLPPLEGYEAVTDASGVFELADLPPGRTRVQAAARGFAPEWSAPVSGDEGGLVEDVALALSESLGFDGRVLDPAGVPVAGALLRMDVSAEERVFTESDEEGRFRLDPPAQVESIVVHCAAAGYWPRRERMRSEARQLPVEIRLTPMPPLTGSVREADGSPVADAEVRLVEHRRLRNRRGTPSAVAGLASTTTGPDGAFSLEIDLTGSWERRFVLVALHDRYVPTLSPILSFDDPEQRAFPPQELVLAPGSLVSGTVLDPSGAAAAGARVHLRKLLAQRAPGRRALVPETRRRSTIQASVSTDAEGAFTFPGIAAGDYRLDAYLPGHSPVESEEFSLGEEPYTCALQLHPASQILGSVAGELALFGTLRVTATSPRADPLDAVVDAAGGFTFDDVPPAEYTLVLREVDPGMEDAAFLFGVGEGLARKEGVQVVVGESTAVALEIDLSERALLRGTVRVNGAPAPEYGVYLLPRELGGALDPRLGWRSIVNRLRSTTTDYQGRYLLAGVDPDEYWLVVDRGGAWPTGLLRLGENGEPLSPAGLGRAELLLQPGAEVEWDVELLLGGLTGRALRMNNERAVRIRGGTGSLRPALAQEGIAERPIDLGRNGAFRVEQVPVGSWLLDLRSGAWRLDDYPIEIAVGERTQPEVVLERVQNSVPSFGNGR